MLVSVVPWKTHRGFFIRSGRTPLFIKMEYTAGNVKRKHGYYDDLFREWQCRRVHSCRGFFYSVELWNVSRDSDSHERTSYTDRKIEVTVHMNRVPLCPRIPRAVSDNFEKKQNTPLRRMIKRSKKMCTCYLKCFNNRGKYENILSLFDNFHVYHIFVIADLHAILPSGLFKSLLFSFSIYLSVQIIIESQNEAP